MKKDRLFFLVLFINIFTLPLAARLGDAFDNRAHEALSQRATTISSLDNFLKTALGFEFPSGISQPLEGPKIVTRLIQDGALLEDSLALRRVRHHFHNPKLSWDQAGLRPPGSSIPIGQSSVVWSQNTNQNLVDGGKRSWHQAREAYFIALTSTSHSERNKWFATTFRLLGHAIHHVQDAAVPSHTRNDSHLPVVNSDRFHAFAERPEILALINTIAASPLDASFLSNQVSSDSRYPVPIARLFDTSAGDIGGSALGNGDGIGIAEYSNANFFSDDTIFPETFPYPGLANLQLSAPELDPTTGKKKTYLIFKPGFGDGTNYRLAQASSLRNITGTNVPTDIGLDYKVFTDYAFKLFARAIGYSAGMIDYFFRGDIRVDPPVFESAPPSNPPTTITLTNLANVTPDEETGNGTLRFALRHDSQFNTSESFPQHVVSNQVSGNISRSPQNVTFSFSSLPLPATMGPECFPAPSIGLVCASYVIYNSLLIYRGPLGGEDDSVIVSRCRVTFSRELYFTGEIVLALGGGEGC